MVRIKCQSDYCCCFLGEPLLRLGFCSTSQRLLAASPPEASFISWRSCSIVGVTKQEHVRPFSPLSLKAQSTTENLP